MKVLNVNNGQKANYDLNGTQLTLSTPSAGSLTVDLAARQKDVRNTVDISLNNDFTGIAEGVGSWYVANIIIPAKEVEVYDTGEVDEEGEPVTDVRDLPLDTNDVVLNLWGLPENATVTNNNDEGGIE